jgi:hypothetical protein
MQHNMETLLAVFGGFAEYFCRKVVERHRKGIEKQQKGTEGVQKVFTKKVAWQRCGGGCSRGLIGLILGLK